MRERHCRHGDARKYERKPRYLRGRNALASRERPERHRHNGVDVGVRPDFRGGPCFQKPYIGGGMREPPTPISELRKNPFPTAFQTGARKPKSRRSQTPSATPLPRSRRSFPRARICIWRTECPATTRRIRKRASPSRFPRAPSFRRTPPAPKKALRPREIRRAFRARGAGF